MAERWSHRVPVTSRTSVRVNHLVLSDNELNTVDHAVRYVVATGEFPPDHQIHEVLRALSEHDEESER